MKLSTIAALAACAGFAALAAGQSSIDLTNKWCWSESGGWINWNTGTLGSDVVIGGTFLRGSVWSESGGWINLGDGSPANGVAYANLTGGDFGVNFNPSTGALTGYAWSESEGWINFGGGAMASPPIPARIDPTPLRFRGFVWSEGGGWINLDHATRFVGLRCVADIDDGSGSGTPDGGVGIEDLLYYLGQYDAGTSRADVDDGTSAGVPDGGVGIEDLLYFLFRYDAGC
jgi:hypothetical protein